MTIEELLQLDSDTECTVLNEPFSYVGTTKLTLEGGDERFWIYDEDGNMLSVSPEAEEIVYFKLLSEDLEPQAEFVSYRNEQYEFSYEDTGTVSHIAEEVGAEEDDVLNFSDYESDRGDLIRIVLNENTGEKEVFSGHVVTEDEIKEIE